MRYAYLGDTGLIVSVVGFGGIPLQRLPMRRARELVSEALRLGVSFFDTARGYGDSECKIGESASRWQLPTVIATKSYCRTAHEARRHVEGSLRRLKLESIALFQIHHVSRQQDLDRILAPEGALDGLVRLKGEGKLAHIGITGHNAQLLLEALSASRQFETVQFPLNIVECDEATRKLIAWCNKHQIGTIAMKPFAGGLIEQKALSLRWALEQGIDVVIPGVAASLELQENVRQGDKVPPLSREELHCLEQATVTLKGELCRRCMYCIPCPAGIPIHVVQELGDKVQLPVPEVQMLCREQYARMRNQVTECQHCGQCEQRCPYNLPVRAMLRHKHELLAAGSKDVC